MIKITTIAPRTTIQLAICMPLSMFFVKPFHEFPPYTQRVTHQGQDATENLKPRIVCSKFLSPATATPASVLASP